METELSRMDIKNHNFINDFISNTEVNRKAKEVKEAISHSTSVHYKYIVHNSVKHACTGIGKD